MRLRNDNPMNRALVTLLAFEVLIFALAYPVMIMVDSAHPAHAAVWVVIACLMALVSCGVLRKPWGWWLAWATQVAGVLLGLLTPGMYLMGAILAVIWIVSFLLGRKIEADQAQFGA